MVGVTVGETVGAVEGDSVGEIEVGDAVVGVTHIVCVTPTTVQWVCAGMGTHSASRMPSWTMLIPLAKRLSARASEVSTPWPFRTT